MRRAKTFLSSKLGIISLVVLVILVGGYWYFFAGTKTPQQFVTVTSGPITETVSVTGNTTPVESVSLGFGTSGTISRVYTAVGNTVSVGTVLATLNTSDINAQLAEAQASVDAATANLHKLQAGATPETIDVSRAQLAVAKQSLNNAYSGVRTTLANAYAQANDAVRNQIQPFFINAETTSPQLTFSVADFSTENQILDSRVQASEELNTWQTEIATLGTDPTSVDQALTSAATRLSVVQRLLSTSVTIATEAIGLSSVTETTYRANATAGLTEVNAALSAINSAQQAIATGEANVAQLSAQLDATTAGATPQDIEAARAQVAQAQANVASIEAKVQNSEIVAPQSGVVTQCDAKVGQVATVGSSLISIISSNAYEVDAQVPETDIGKIAVGDAVSMTFDAFQGETFSGKVFYIDPAETITQGVVDYKIKISFNTPDPRMKSGLTSNLTIQTNHKDNVLILPQYAVLQNDSGTFVEILQNNKTVDVPVTLGIQDESGNVEIASGVTSGEQVLNIGLKQ